MKGNLGYSKVSLEGASSEEAERTVPNRGATLR
jgi:hypothetical protein